MDVAMIVAERHHVNRVASVAYRLEAGSTRIPFSGCQVWLGSDNGNGRYGRGGYGVITVNRRLRYVHRLSYELNVGAIPEGRLVCHRCDVRACINPDHLFLSDAMGNHLDKVAKGRARAPGAVGDANATRKYPWLVRGANNGRAKLTLDDVEAIRNGYAGGIQQRELASRYGVGQSQIGRICRGEQWT